MQVKVIYMEKEKDQIDVNLQNPASRPYNVFENLKEERDTHSKMEKVRIQKSREVYTTILHEMRNRED